MVVGLQLQFRLIMLFYQLFVWLYYLSIRLLALFNPKAKKWVEGRKGIFGRLQTEVSKSPDPIIWMHCASLGEFEQGRPVLEALRVKYPQKRILLTFFSPSGYEIRKNHPGVDMVFYMPMDFKSDAERFLDLVNPELAIFVKYESWMNYLIGLKSRNIPSLLISAIFTPEQSFFGPLGKFLRSMLEKYSVIFVQQESSKQLLEKFNVKTDIRVSGDTRFDRVAHLPQLPLSHPVIEAFSIEAKVLVAGSTWHDDIKCLSKLQEDSSDLRMIIAPHEISETGIQKTTSMFSNARLLSEATLENIADSRVLIIDTIGMLSKLYRFGRICYVGGGFNQAGIHNILEAATYGKPIFFGPNHNRTAEAGELIALGAVVSFRETEDFVRDAKDLLNDDLRLAKMGAIASDYVQNKTGATELILSYVGNLASLR